MIWEQFTDKILIILTCAAMVSFGIGIWKNGSESNWKPLPTFKGCIDGFSIAVAIIIIVLVTAINNYQKQKQFAKLLVTKDDRTILTRRNGKPIVTNICNLLVGDIIYIAQGEKLPVDCILISGAVKIDESSQTGESEEVAKLSYTDQQSNCFLISGSLVMDGKGEALVCAVGANTLQGKINSALEEQEMQETPLQCKLGRVTNIITYIGITVAVITLFALFLSQSIRKWAGYDHTHWISHTTLKLVVDDITVALAILAIAIPEGLPLAVTISLAYSINKMKDENNFVRQLESCETMGGANNICTDKTGTLTKNQMTIVSLYTEQCLCESISSLSIAGKTKEMIVNGSLLNSDSYISRDDGKIVKYGNATEIALIELANSLLPLNINEIRAKYKEVYSECYSSIRKHMITIRESSSSYTAYIKGAPEIVLEYCSHYIDHQGQVNTLQEEHKTLIKDAILAMNQKSYRTICMAQKEISSISESDISHVRDHLTFVAVAGIEDPLKEGTAEAIQKCRLAGVTTRIVTGDSKETAISIAIQSGVIKPEEVNAPNKVMSGSELNALLGGFIKVPNPRNPAKLVDSIKHKENIPTIDKNLKVLYRSTPVDKLLLVTALQANQNNVIAATGDGTNDAPALRKANVGFAMGIAGTQVAKDASHIVLLDDNFGSIVVAIKWGRNIYNCIRKFIQFQLTSTFIALIVTFIGSIVIGESPFSTVQLLWINLIQDTFASLALATEPPSDELLEEKPYSKQESLISSSVWRNIYGQSIFQIVAYFLILFMFPYFDVLSLGRVKAPHEAWSIENGKLYTFFFNTFVFFQIFNEINCRKIKPNEYNVFKNFFNNVWFIVIVLATVTLQLLFVNFGGEAMHCSPLGWEQQCASISFGMVSLLFCIVLIQACLRR